METEVAENGFQMNRDSEGQFAASVILLFNHGQEIRTHDRVVSPTFPAWEFVSLLQNLPKQKVE
jgi:hypothetical protein